MGLIPAFEADLAREETYFRKHLLTEDIARLKRLEALCAQSPDFAAFEKAGMRIGWTRDDMRTASLAEPIREFLTMLWRAEREGGAESAIREAWLKLDGERMRILVHCL